MERLEILKAEKEQIKKMRCLSFDLRDACMAWYDHEIEYIEKYKTVGEKGEEK